MKVLVVLLIVSGCGTSSIMRCDRFIGVEKEECLRKTKLNQIRILGNRYKFMNNKARVKY